MTLLSATTYPKKKKRKKDEAIAQKAVIKWSRLAGLYPYLIHIPNGGSRNAFEAIDLKRQGVKAGVSDLFLALPSQGMHGLWLELKSTSKTARVTETQKNWLDLMKSKGYEAKVARGFDEAREIIKEYLCMKDGIRPGAL